MQIFFQLLGMKHTEMLTNVGILLSNAFADK